MRFINTLITLAGMVFLLIISPLAALMIIVGLLILIAGLGRFNAIKAPEAPQMAADIRADFQCQSG